MFALPIACFAESVEKGVGVEQGERHALHFVEAADPSGASLAVARRHALDQARQELEDPIDSVDDEADAPTLVVDDERALLIGRAFGSQSEMLLEVDDRYDLTA